MDGQENNFAQSNTYQNLQAAVEMELLDSAKLAVYAQTAREEMDVQISNIFKLSSKQEKEHAIILMNLLDEMNSTLENLQGASEEENQKWTSVFVDYAEEARNEGYPEIAVVFEELAEIARSHDRRFRRLAQGILNETTFCRRYEVLWECLNCGNIIFGNCAPEVCPVCGYPQGFYQLNCENY